MRRRILLADDSVTIQKVIELTFLDEDYEVKAVSNGDEAIAALPQVNPDAGVNPLYAYYWSVNAQTTDEAKKAAAFKLIGFLSSFPGRWLSESEFIQPKVGWEESEEAKAMPFIEVWSSEMLKGKFQPVVPNGEQVQTIMKSTIVVN